MLFSSAHLGENFGQQLYYCQSLLILLYAQEVLPAFKEQVTIKRKLQVAWTFCTLNKFTFSFKGCEMAFWQIWLNSWFCKTKFWKWFNNSLCQNDFWKIKCILTRNCNIYIFLHFLSKTYSCRHFNQERTEERKSN